MKGITVAVSILGLAKPLVEVYEAGKEIYIQVAKTMQAVESAGVITDGAQKKATVMDYIKGTVAEVFTNWSKWKGLIAAFIERIITVYNALVKA